MTLMRSDSVQKHITEPTNIATHIQPLFRTIMGREGVVFLSISASNSLHFETSASIAIRVYITRLLSKILLLLRAFINFSLLVVCCTCILALGLCLRLLLCCVCQLLLKNMMRTMSVYFVAFTGPTHCTLHEGMARLSWPWWLNRLIAPFLPPDGHY